MTPRAARSKAAAGLAGKATMMEASAYKTKTFHTSRRKARDATKILYDIREDFANKVLLFTSFSVKPDP
jgi:hypothetical protein